LTWSPRPIEIKLFSTDVEWLKQKAPQIEAELKKIEGVVDTFDGLETTGPSLSLHVRDGDAQRFGLTVNDVSMASRPCSDRKPLTFWKATGSLISGSE